MNTLKQFPYQNVLVLGLAKSGTAAARILLENGKNVRVNDMKREEENEEAKELKQLGVEVITGHHPLTVLDGIEIVIKNPGIPYENPVVAEAIKRNIPVITEIELAGQLAEGPIVGITGSNGKTTTTTLVYEMLRSSGEKANISGNIGTVASEVAKDIESDEILVVELSSFQLLGIQSFKPTVSVLLNIFEAHLDYHKTLDHYANAKANIFSNQTESDFVVYNLDDDLVVELVENAKAKKVPFSTKQHCQNGAWFDGQTVYFQDQPIMDKREIVLVGEHNFENILAAIAAASLMGAKPEAIRNVLTTFQGVRHRTQFVRKLNNRSFYNDSKATNLLATSRALESFEQPVILLAGGLDRGNDFDGLIPYLDNVKELVVFGQTADKLIKVAKQAGIEHVKIVDNVEHAVHEAYASSEEGDVILLSPACASWDQYRSFEERGDMFVRAVHKL
ncbi:UDP-N-acetylmuramoyl-L-alanine--D-glutamate ligase [Salinibacillus xinjiangensis]|uniref:UDP-N-acetylmuramoylalanine--D-glutamate ligase n=1 Tax=Salinibacillus xinjiangensis TaxID=1229268 RepID=A0A6G1X3C1_9BACI|nr:UDP-N-acetylmuramoyl-L-alanine--D-glutamate ligase [Salinibacillus xinjiangensis]MRG85493.1 UDP-N-acetylmuramoyl-L-alanine--D-glutamate ligase [Salinibacillus xinjiangensis]